MTATALNSVLQALQPYEHALNSGGRLVAIRPDGSEQVWDTRRWLADLDEADHTVLARCAGPTLDVGCGPGRFVQAWALTGRVALGVDISSAAVELTARRGASVLQRDVFARVPGEGRWRTVLLMDGNIGIGGDPGSLMLRLAELIAGDGQLLVEIDPDEHADEELQLQLTSGDGRRGPRLAWARVGGHALGRHARRAGLRPAGQWQAGERTFARLVATGDQSEATSGDLTTAAEARESR